MAWGSVSRGVHRRSIELRNHRSGVPTLLDDGEGNMNEGAKRALIRLPGVRDLWHVHKLHEREPGDPANWPCWVAPRGPRRESKEYDGDERVREVGQLHSTCEALEQGLRCAVVCGEGGGKGADQGESVQ